MKEYYVRFNENMQKVDVLRKKDHSLIESVEVINGVVHSWDSHRIADVLSINDSERIAEIEYEIFCEDRDGRELMEMS